MTTCTAFWACSTRWAGAAPEGQAPVERTFRGGGGPAGARCWAAARREGSRAAAARPLRWAGAKQGAASGHGPSRAGAAARSAAAAQRWMASEAQIKAAYRKAALLHHPDKQVRAWGWAHLLPSCPLPRCAAARRARCGACRHTQAPWPAAS